MLKLIADIKGSGKTKELVEKVNAAAGTSNGKVVCIEKGTKLTFDISHDVRLLNTEDYNVAGYDAFYGFIAGIVASDFDVKEIFVDSLGKIVGDDYVQIGALLAKLEKLIQKDGIALTATVSAEQAALPAECKKYL